MREKLPAIILVSLALVLCSCNPLVREYQPVAEKEKRAYEIADRYIFPGDVRKAPADYKDTTVAWTGVVVDREFITHPRTIEIRYTLRHHYYDWVEDFNNSKEKMFLSSRGEGTFVTSWRLKSLAKIEKLKHISDVGALIIAYGKPSGVNPQGDVVLSAKYIKVLKENKFRTDTRNYGRPVDPDIKKDKQQASARQNADQ